MAKKLSIPQLEAAVRNGTLESFIAIPLIAQKTKLANAAKAGEQPPSSVASQVLQQAQQGVAQLSSNLPEQGMAGGGIVAFAGEDGSLVEDRRSPSDKAMDEVIARIMRNPSFNQTIPPATNTGESGGVTELFPVDIGVSPEFGGTTSEALTADADRVARLKADRAAAEEKQRREFLSKAAPHLLPPETPKAPAPQSNIDSQYAAQDMQEGGRGITAAPGAKLAPPGTPGAPRTAPAANIPLTTGEMRSDVAAGKGSMLDQYAEMLMKEREGSAKDKQQAKGMAIFQAGLGIAGGTSPNAFANLAQGALPAITQYQSALKDIRKEDRDRIGKLIEMGVSKEKLAMELRKLGIEEKKVDAMVNYYNAKAAGGGSGDKEDRLVRQGYEKSGIEYDSLARRARANMASALNNDREYTGAKQQLAFNKNLKPEDKAKFEQIIKDKEAPYISEIQDYSTKSKYFMKQAGMNQSSGSGGKEDVDLNQFFK